MSYSLSGMGDAWPDNPTVYNPAGDPQESNQYTEAEMTEVMNSDSVLTNPVQLDYASVMPLQGNLLFWTTDDPRQTVIWGEETVLDSNGTKIQRPIEFTINTPAGYAVQTKTFIHPRHGGPGAEFWWATLMQLGLCTYKDAQIPMAHFLNPGTTSECSRFYVEGDGRCFEWCRDPNQPLIFTLYDIPTGCIHAQYVGGPFEKPDLHRSSTLLPPHSLGLIATKAPLLIAYMQYHWSQDDTLLMFAILSISIRRWTEMYDLF